MFNVGAQEKGINVYFECMNDIPKELEIDEQRIKQVILNLLQNALKFTFEGSIKLELKYDYK